MVEPASCALTPKLNRSRLVLSIADGKQEQRMVTYDEHKPRAWTVAEAKARLSEVLRRAEEEGPQRIGHRKAFVVVSARVWDEKTEPRDEAQERPGPFDDWTEEDWKALDRSEPGRGSEE